MTRKPSATCGKGEADSDVGDAEPGRGMRERNYEVGYGKPPKQHQFQPGESGNKKGRPRNSSNLRTILKQLLDEPFELVVRGKKRRFKGLEALARTSFFGSLKGDSKSFAIFIALLKQAGLDTEAVEARKDPLDDIDHVDVIKEYERKKQKTD